MNLKSNQLNMPIGQQQLHKMKQQPLPPLVDLSLTRMYFHTFSDFFYRFNLLITQIIWIAIVFLDGLMISDFISATHHFPIAQILQIIFKVGSLVLTVIFAVLVLFLIIPLFLVKTIKSVTCLTIFYFIFGTLFNLFLITISLFMIFNNFGTIALITFCGTIVTLIDWFVTLILWLIAAKQKRKRLIKSIIKTYELTLK